MNKTASTTEEPKRPATAAKVVGITGNRGFLATALLRCANASKHRLVTLARSPLADAAENVESRSFDLADATAAADLKGIEILIHAAAATGKASRGSYDSTNNLATRRLLGVARDAGVRRIIYISSIAVRSPLSQFYPYAKSKQAAEEAVRESRIPYTIIRPTLILGPGSPIGAALEKLARLPVMPLFGGAAAKVQPVDVDDLAEYIWTLVERFDEGPTNAATVEIGGRETITMRELMLKIRERVRGSRGLSLAVPVRWMLRPLYTVEPLLLPLLPVTAGQLTGFICDGCCDPQFTDASFVPRHDLAAMIERTVSHK